MKIPAKDQFFIQSILWLCIKLSGLNKCSAFFDYSPQVNSISVKVVEGKKYADKALYDETTYFKPDQHLGKSLELIQSDLHYLLQQLLLQEKGTGKST